MADKIRLLPEVVANQIAAGEVVNRPASVVKEMMENAIDAGATSVKVNFRDGGKDLIQIVDDGCGMSPIDARMAFDRHATSKIGAVEDIYALHTFGFRGEALASIAAVSQVELRTRQAGDEVGTQTEINGGQFAAQNPVMCPVGSQFFVRNLFYNVPARRRFLDKSTTSASQIKAEFQRIALCNPQIAFELYANDAPVYTLQAGSLAGRIVDVVGRHIKQNLLEVEADTSIACIEGYIGRPAAAKKRNTEQYLFVNGRFFKSTYLTSAILKAYEKLIPESCQPSYFLYLTLDPGRIDVNVHPQKTEVKFADEEAVWQIVNAAVRVTLAVGATMVLTYFVPYVDPGSVWFFPVLGLAAPAVYVASVVLTLYWIIRWRWVCAGAMLVVVVAGLFKVSLFWRPEIRRSYATETAFDRAAVKVMSYNVRSFYGEDGRSSVDDILRLIEEQAPDLICLQEFNARLAEQSEEFSLLGEKYEIAHFGRTQAPDSVYGSTLTILSKYRILRSDTVLTPSSSVWADVIVGEDTVRVFNNHLRSTAINASDNQFITSHQFLSDTARETKIRSIVTRLRENSVLRAAQVDSIAQVVGATRTRRIVCGDFNDTPMSYVYRTMARGLRDAFRECGSGYSHTFRGFYNTLRIDYVLSGGFEPLSYEVLPVDYSDHHPVVVRLRKSS